MSSLKRKKKLIVSNLKHKLEEAFFHGTRRDFQLGQFILLSVPISPPPQLPSLTLFNSLVFSNNRCNLTSLFVDNNQMVLNNEPLLKAGILFSCK